MDEADGQGPEDDLDTLEATHFQEEAAEAERDLERLPRPMQIRTPAGGRLPSSEHWLERLYGYGGLPREKKPAVFDHVRSVGPWFVSVDDEPLSVLDGMSQTATVCGGFAEDPVVCAYVQGEFGDTLTAADDVTQQDHWAAQRFAERLRELVPGLPHVSFVSSGAEACEKALALCRLQAGTDRQRRVLAFEGSFHGRTLLSLHASYNPKKRAPFEIAGHEVTYAPFPLWRTPQAPEPTIPEGYLEAIADGDFDSAARVGAGADPLLGAELESLRAVHRHLQGGEHFAVLIEPMQSEGGDRYGSARFYRALRLLTRHHDVPLVFDEVQTGFGLGGTFTWHERFGLRDRDGRPDGPDCLTFAKRAQVGVVMSRFADPEPTATHPASLVRGRIHADMMAADTQAGEVQRQVRERLAALAERFPELVSEPRATGYALAFDLPSADHLAAYLGQRFWRGAIIFGAGTRTVRYRLSKGFDAAAIDPLFETMEASLRWLEEHPGEKPPAWQDPEPPRVEAAGTHSKVRVRHVSGHEQQRALDGVIALEQRVYEPARQDPPEKLRLAFDDPDGVATLAESSEDDDWKIVGYCLGVPLERMAEVPGPDRDPMLHRHNSLYSMALTVDPDYQGLGLGKRLKKTQLEAARAMQAEDGTPRYRHVCGRNRLGRADTMSRVNRAFGAYTVCTIEGSYGEPDAVAWYYRQPVGPFRMDPVDAEGGPQSSQRDVDLGGGLARPFAEAPKSLRDALGRGLLYGPAVHKITICNYVTPAVVRGAEWVSSLTPELPHLYLASSRDETFDKTLRALRWHRTEGQVVLGLEGGYVGHTSAAARSLSDPDVHRQGPGYFEGWMRVPHPAEAGVDKMMQVLRAAIEQAGGPHRVLGLFVEPVQERTGRVIPDDFWPAADALRRELGVPIILVETATATYRSGRGPFHSSGLSFTPDVLTWWGGGQIGFVHVGKRWFVDRPLTLVSTWDGDELSLVRVHHQLRAARWMDVAGIAERLDRALAPAREAGMDVRGEGLYRTLAAGEHAEGTAARLAERGIGVRRYPGGIMALAPPFDVSEPALQQLEETLREVSR